MACQGWTGTGQDKVRPMEKVIIIGVIVNLGTLIVLYWFLNRIQKLLQEHPSPKQEEETKEDDSWHSWRFWLPPEDEPPKHDTEEPSVQKGQRDLPEERGQTGQDGRRIKADRTEEKETSQDEDDQPPADRS